MIPQIIQLGPLPINSFGLMVALAILAAIKCLEFSFERYGVSAKLAEKYALSGGLLGLLGARFWYLFSNLDEFLEDPVGGLFGGAGFTFLGGFIVAAACLLLMARKDKIKSFVLLDSVSPALALGYAIGRVGCQLSGDGDYGIPSDSLFAMSYASGFVPTPPGVLVLPTPFFESLMALGILLVILKVEKTWRVRKTGQVFGIYLALMAIERFIIEFYRIEPKFFGGFSQAQFISVPLLLLGVVFVSGVMSKDRVTSTCGS